MKITQPSEKPIMLSCATQAGQEVPLICLSEAEQTPLHCMLLG